MVRTGLGRTSLHYSDPSCYPGNTFQPTSPQPIRRKRRAGDRVETKSDIGRDVRREGARWGTPRKRALLGLEGQNSVSSVSDVAEAQLGWPPDDEYPAVAQSGWPPEDEYLEEARSPRVELVDAVAKRTGGIPDRIRIIPSQTSGGSGFTSTSVPMYAGKSSWDQYRQVFEAIVCSNGWDGVTATLQLVSHLKEDTLNVALLVPASQRVLLGVLVGVLLEHYGSPVRLAEYRCECISAFAAGAG